MMRRSLLLLVPSLLILALFLAGPKADAGHAARVSFDQGVASGDVTSRSAVLWTRASRETELEVQVSLRQDFKGKKITRDAEAMAESDFIVKTVVGGLQPDQTYFYRFKAGRGRNVSDVGTFRTPPKPGDSANVRFAFSSDTDGSAIPPINNFEVLDRAREDGIDFWVWIGDTVYNDTNPPIAVTVEQMRAKYKQVREFDALRRLLAATSTYTIWDDHEVENDFDGTTVDPVLLANGLQVFKEYMPIRDEGNILFRSFRLGTEVELIILDERQFRSPDVEAICGGDLIPGLGLAFFELVPQLQPLLDLRESLGLSRLTDPVCLAALNDPTRTMLGAEQKEFLKSTLLDSGATWKIVINELAFGELFAMPYDRWEGYAAERAEILNFIRDNNIENVVFLTGDLHANIIGDVRVNAFVDPAPIVKEAIAGPVAQNTVFQGLVMLLGSEAAALQLAGLVSSLTNPDCLQLDAFGYGLVEVDSQTKGLTITLKGDDGEVLNDQLAELVGVDVPCTTTLQAE